MNILITGASGFIGQPLVEYLSEAGHNVTAIVRKSDTHYSSKINVIQIKYYMIIISK